MGRERPSVERAELHRRQAVGIIQIVFPKRQGRTHRRPHRRLQENGNEIQRGRQPLPNAMQHRRHLHQGPRDVRIQRQEGRRAALISSMQVGLKTIFDKLISCLILNSETEL